MCVNTYKLKRCSKNIHFSFILVNVKKSDINNTYRFCNFWHQTCTPTYSRTCSLSFLPHREGSLLFLKNRPSTRVSPPDEHLQLVIPFLHLIFTRSHSTGFFSLVLNIRFLFLFKVFPSWFHIPFQQGPFLLPWIVHMPGLRFSHHQCPQPTLPRLLPPSAFQWFSLRSPLLSRSLSHSRLFAGSLQQH